MHEYSVTSSILESAVARANEVGAKRILNIKIVMGKFVSIIDESIQFYFDIMSKDTIAREARLIFEKRDGKEFYIDSIEVEQ